jgi:hydrogenase nickel incorporation protein HypB
MCATCGCDTQTEYDYEYEHERGNAHAYDYIYVDEDEHALAQGHEHEHEHGHAHGHAHELAPPLPRPTRTIRLEHDVLAHNDALADRNRAFLAARRITAFNFTSAPGAGKTALLETAIRRLDGRVPLAVVEGDQETARDADRIRATGAPAVQINTRTGCHLDAEMMRSALTQLDPPRGALLLVENVGNLVCPALFDLGERAKIVVTSVTEGEDKPLKYPHMFRAAEVLVVSKIDLLPHLDFDLDALQANARRVNPRLQVFTLSARDGTGVGPFVDWLAAQAVSAQA